MSSVLKTFVLLGVLSVIVVTLGGWGEKMLHLFSTHPPVEERIKRYNILRSISRLNAIFKGLLNFFI